MDSILCVRFTRNAKIEYVDSSKFTLKVGDSVIIETDRGLEIGKVVKIIGKDSIKDDVQIKKIVRVASKDDIKKERDNYLEAKQMLKKAKIESSKLGLGMKFLASEYTLDKSKLIFYFTSEDRVDFRELVRILASEVKTRIELRQIGPRDEVKMYENLGMCGREVCCRTHLKDFKSVAIKDAKEQGLQINMDKLSGACGKLMCCLKYEEEEYRENQKNLPKYNEVVKVKETGETGRVSNLDILKMKVKVRFGDSKDNERFETFDSNDLSWKSKE